METGITQGLGYLTRLLELDFRLLVQTVGCCLLCGVVVGVVEHKVGEDDEDAFLAVAAEFVVAVEGGGVRLRVVGRRERSVLGHVTAEDPVARRTCHFIIHR